MSSHGLRTLSGIVKADRRQPLHEISAKFNESAPEKCSMRTVQRNLHAFGFKWRLVRKKINIRVVNRRRRVYRCRTKLHWRVVREWQKVIFSDEMMIDLKPDSHLKVWRKAIEKWRPECLGYVAARPTVNLKLMVWVCVCYTGVGMLAFVDGNMNSEKYNDTLENYLWPSIAKHFNNDSWVFQEDNVPAHKSRLLQAWKERNNLPVLMWPAQSPDLSPIENLWLLMINKVKSKLYWINTPEDLKTVMMTTWNNMALAYIQRLYATLPLRVWQVLIQKGHITKY